MKSYKTTIIGALLAGVSFLGIYQGNGGNLSDWKQWVIPFLIAVLGYLAKDANVTGSVKTIGFMLACSALLTSCGLTREQWTVIGKDVLLREAPIVYGQVQQARTAAKNPGKPVAP